MGVWVVEFIVTEILNCHPNPILGWCPLYGKEYIRHLTKAAADAYMLREQQKWDTAYPDQYAFRVAFYSHA